MIPLLAAVLVATLMLPPLVVPPSEGVSVSFGTYEGWFPLEPTATSTAQAEACAPAGVTRLALTVPGIGSSALDGPSSCLSTSIPATASAPGDYRGTARATFANGAIGCAEGSVHLTILPRNLHEVEGFPPLDEINPADVVLNVELELTIGADRTVRDYLVTSGPDVLLDRPGSVTPLPSDTFVLIELRPIGARLDIDGGAVWSGPVQRTGPEWWHLDPLPTAEQIVERCP